MNILIAEDEIITLRRIQRFLEKWGHRVITARNGLEALEKFLSDKVDIIITDWMMPEMDGLEFVRNLKRRSNDQPYIYIILLTSKGNKEDVVQALDCGVDDYIVKPFDPDELQARINVGKRTVKLERALKEYSYGLEKIVRRQTSVIRHTQEETIIRLLTALEARDQETGGHVRRIGLFSCCLAKAAGWPSEKINDLHLAAPMHDIGKIGIPDSILLKKGRLTEKEYAIIKSHTIIGGRILGGSEYPMLQMAHDIALYHHEKWDGTGYPMGLAGEKTPKAARIVALADVYDALSQDRIYRKASPEDELLKNIKVNCGIHFDPYYYGLFVESIPEFKRIAKENP